MKIFKVLSILLSYPEVDTQEALAEMAECIARESRLPSSNRAALVELISGMASEDLLELQARYVALFDRGRALSLYLYEHLHGESRDRGQAMVNLMAHYRRHGFELDSRELPDYLPLLLEFLAQIDAPAALAMLEDAMPIVSLIGARLRQRHESVAAVFEALEALAGGPDDVAAIRARVAGEGPEDTTLVNMDRIWEEEAVSFMANPRQCGASGSSQPQPLRFVPRA